MARKKTESLRAGSSVSLVKSQAVSTVWEERLIRLFSAVWAGALIAVGYLAVPVLFHELAESRMLAGKLAGEMFAKLSWAGFACAALLVVLLIKSQQRQVWRDARVWLVVVMAALSAANLFGIQPIMTTLKAEVFPLDVMQSHLRDDFARWHGLSSVLYMCQSVGGLCLVLLPWQGARRAV